MPLEVECEESIDTQATSESMQSYTDMSLALPSPADVQSCQTTELPNVVR